MENFTWRSFKERLKAAPNLDLQFQYAESKWADPAYHITEIKQATITSVDCGGLMNSWTEVILQVWESGTSHQDRPMKVNKALSIIALVEATLALSPDALIKIEYGNACFDTRQMLPQAIIINGENLIVDLRADSVQCKAVERGGSCGTNGQSEACCTTPIDESKPKISLINLAGNASCEPGTSCC